MDTKMPRADASPEMIPAIGPPRCFMPLARGGHEGLVVAAAYGTTHQRSTASTEVPGSSAFGEDTHEQANQYNQSNLYQSLTFVNPGYSVDHVREEMRQLMIMNEAERRHHIARRYQDEASEMRLDTLEQQAERRHLEVVAQLGRNISSIDVRAADREKNLVAELQSLQGQNMAMQRDHAGNVSIAVAIMAQRRQAIMKWPNYNKSGIPCGRVFKELHQIP